MSKQLTVLVTGASGCIGSWVLLEILRRGWKPIATDIGVNKVRPGLLIGSDELDMVPWIPVDIVDTEAVSKVISENNVDAVIHLGALQVPFCKADPVVGAQVNVVGTANILEAVKKTGIKRLSFASSVAIQSMHGENNPYLATLYGAYKACTESMAQVYWQDWGVPSVCIRPGVVYGVGRDQGMTSATTKALLAAVAGQSYTIPYRGDISFLYTQEVAGAFVSAIENEQSGYYSFDLNGRCASTEQYLKMVKELLPDSDIKAEGEALPFPADLSDDPIQNHLGDYGVTSLESGMKDTIERFKELLDTKAINLDQLNN